MPQFDAVDGGEEAAKSPVQGRHSVLGANASDQTRKLRVNDSGQAEVVIVEDQTGDTLNVGILQTGVTGNIADSTPTVITTYVAPSIKKISKISVSGEAPADFELRYNGSTIDEKHTDTQELDDEFSFKHPWVIATSDIVEIRVTHQAPGKSRSFRATLYGV